MSETTKQKWSPPWTILKVLQWTAEYFERNGVDDTARLDAELLLASVLDIERVKLYANYNQPLQQEELDAFKKLIKRRLKGEPVAYLTGHRQFWSLDLKTDNRALIPRPETENLVSKILDLLDEDSSASILDIGTGTGAIALALVDELPNISVTATDVSKKALELAEENAKLHNLEQRVTLFESDLFDKIDSTFDIIASNPPYVSSEVYNEQISESIRQHEPEQALEAGIKGLDILKRLIPESVKYLDKDGYLIVEIGHKQGGSVRKLFEKASFQNVELGKDEAELDRFVVGQKN